MNVGPFNTNLLFHQNNLKWCLSFTTSLKNNNTIAKNCTNCVLKKRRRSTSCRLPSRFHRHQSYYKRHYSTNIVPLNIKSRNKYLSVEYQPFSCKHGEVPLKGIQLLRLKFIILTKKPWLYLRRNHHITFVKMIT